MISQKTNGGTPADDLDELASSYAVVKYAGGGSDWS